MKANAAFAARHAFPYRLLSDTGREVGLLYGACEDREASSAKRVSYLIGPDGRVVKAYASVKASEHPRQVLDDLRASSFGRPGGAGSS